MRRRARAAGSGSEPLMVSGVVFAAAFSRRKSNYPPVGGRSRRRGRGEIWLDVLRNTDPDIGPDA